MSIRHHIPSALAGLVVAVAASAPAAALSNDPAPNLIQGAPVPMLNGVTASDSADFPLLPPTYPGYNECRVNYGGWRKCSWFYGTGALVNGSYLLQVRRFAPGASTPEKDDFWSWYVRAGGGAPDLTTLPVCSFPYSTRNVPGFRFLQFTTTNGSAAPYVLQPFGGTIPAGRAALAVQQPAPTSTGHALGAPAPTGGQLPPGGVFSWGYSLAPPILADQPGFVDTFWTPPGKGAGDLRRQISPAWTGLVDCLRALPPAGITENADGTRSATFGWINGGALPVAAPVGGTARTVLVQKLAIGTNQVSRPGNAGAPQPTAFPAYSSGTWTYTWTPAPGDENATITWTLGASTASFRPGAPARIPAGSPVNPFTHVDAQTPHVSPPTVISQTSAATAAPTPAQTGGDVNTLTRLTISSRVASPRSRTVSPGQLIRLTSVLRNTGAVDAVNPRICETIPVGLTFVSAPGRELKKGTRQVCWTNPRLAAGAAVSGSMTLRVARNARRGSRTNTLQASATNGCTVTTFAQFFVGRAPAGIQSQTAFTPVTLANTPAQSNQVGADAAQGIATLKLATRVSAPSSRKVRRGKTVSIRGTITNTSGVTARSLRLCERVPVGMRVVRAPNHGPSSARTICWSSPELASGASATGTTVLRAVSDAKIGVRANRSTVSAVNACPRTSRATFTVRP